MWNRDGPIGTSTGYAALVADTSQTQLRYTSPAAGPYIFLSSTGGHPGRAAFQATAATGGGRAWATFAIAAFQVSVEGIYSISNGFLVRQSQSDCAQSHLCTRIC
jgi:hypothetical protein